MSSMTTFWGVFPGKRARWHRQVRLAAWSDMYPIGEPGDLPQISSTSTMQTSSKPMKFELTLGFSLFLSEEEKDRDKRSTTRYGMAELGLVSGHFHPQHIALVLAS